MIRLTMAALGLLLGASLTATAGEYRLNPGDVLEISVWKEEALQREVLVLPDGTLAFPLAGHVDAAGKTPSQIQGQVAARLGVPFLEMRVISNTTGDRERQAWAIGGALRKLAGLAGDIRRAIQAP